MKLSRFAFCVPRLLKNSSLSTNRLYTSYFKNYLPAPVMCSHSTNRNFSNKNDVEIDGNPFFDKYKDKILHMQNTNPEDYEEKIKELTKRLHPKVADTKVEVKGESKEGLSNPVKVARPSEAARAGVGMTRTKSLDSIMKMELIENKTTEEITKIWNQYHSDKDCIFAVIKDHEFENLVEMSKECPVFVFPVRRNDGYEMILAQFDRHDVYFTPLAMFQLMKEDSPPCLTLNHYTELMEDKGIVLMTGQYDDKVLSQQLALSLVQQLSIFYGKNSKYYDLVHTFNHKPELFDYKELMDAFKTLPHHDMQ